MSTLSPDPRPAGTARWIRRIEQHLRTPGAPELAAWLRPQVTPAPGGARRPGGGEAWRTAVHHVLHAHLVARSAPEGLLETVAPEGLRLLLRAWVQAAKGGVGGRSQLEAVESGVRGLVLGPNADRLSAEAVAACADADPLVGLAAVRHPALPRARLVQAWTNATTPEDEAAVLVNPTVRVHAPSVLSALMTDVDTGGQTSISLSRVIEDPRVLAPPERAPRPAWMPVTISAPVLRQVLVERADTPVALRLQAARGRLAGSAPARWVTAAGIETLAEAPRGGGVDWVSVLLRRGPASGAPEAVDRWLTAVVRWGDEHPDAVARGLAHTWNPGPGLHVPALPLSHPGTARLLAHPLREVRRQTMQALHAGRAATARELDTPGTRRPVRRSGAGLGGRTDDGPSRRGPRPA